MYKSYNMQPFAENIDDDPNAFGRRQYVVGELWRGGWEAVTR